MFRIGGYGMGEVGWVDDRGLEEDTGAKLNDDAQWRRLRLYASGLIRGKLEFKVQSGLAGSGTRLVDAWIRLRDVPGVGDVTS